VLGAAALRRQSFDRGADHAQRFFRGAHILQRGSRARRILRILEMNRAAETLQVALAARMLARAIGQQVDGDSKQERLRVAHHEQMLVTLQAQIALLRDVVGVRARQTRTEEAQQLGVRRAAQLHDPRPAQR
jgi:hypothetical protein